MAAKRSGGFTILELLFVLTLMAIFAASFSFIPAHQKTDADDVIKFRDELSKAIFACRIKSIMVKEPVLLTIDLSEKNFVITYNDEQGKQTIKKPLNTDKVTTCQFWKLPTRTEGVHPAMQTKISEATFKNKFFVPFELEFTFKNGDDESRKVIIADKTCSLTISDKLYKEKNEKAKR